MNTAGKTIEILRDKFETEKSNLDAFVSIDNYELNEELNDRCSSVRDIGDQETWVMSDGSFITRNQDEYWTGDNVDDFELNAYLA